MSNCGPLKSDRPLVTTDQRGKCGTTQEKNPTTGISAVGLVLPCSSAVGRTAQLRQRYSPKEKDSRPFRGGVRPNSACQDV